MTQRAIDYRAKKLQDLEAQKKAIENQIEEIRAEIQKDMGESEQLETTKYLIKWIFVNGSRFDTKRFKENNPEMYNAYSKENISRRFTVTSK